jgi:hypothetical protein
LETLISTYILKLCDEFTTKTTACNTYKFFGEGILDKTND